MSVPERGFHPVQRAVSRLAEISPHRQVQLLCAISVVTVAIMVAAVLGSLSPTNAALRTSTGQLVPTVNQLETARTKYNAAASVFGLANTSDPTVRSSAVAQLASANSAGESAWNAYVRSAAGLPGEHALQLQFVGHRKAAFETGLIVLSAAPSADALATEARYTDALRLDLNRIKELYDTKIQQSLRAAREHVDQTQRQIIAVSIGAILVLLIAFGVAARSARSREQRTENLDRALHEDSERNELEARLQRSLEMAHTEIAAYGLVGRALSISAPDVPAELLVADSSRAHFRQAAATENQMGRGCSVTSPADCPAASWGQTQVWHSSTALDSCPHLQDRPEGACSAVCVPISIAGKTVGVVHATAPDNHPPEPLVVAKIELIARKVGERVGMLRAFLRSETQAHTDPLTGLMNRRSLEEKVRAITESGLTYVVAYGDLDHFKQLNDLHGHDAGDQALRLFSRVLRDAVRPHDLTARYGGEEFVVVLPDCQISDAYAVINRLRESLAATQGAGSGPRFTVSFGIAAARPEDTFSQTLELADTALLKAKASGRDRILISGAERPVADADGTPPRSAADLTL